MADTSPERRGDASGTLTALLRHPLSALMLLVAIAIAAKQLTLLVPGMPLPVITLAIGVAIGTLAERALRDAPKRVPFEIALAMGMILLGAQIDQSTIALVGGIGVGALLFHWLMIGVLFALAVRMRLLPARRGGLMAVGLTGCGISAVLAAAASDPHATREEATLGTAVVLACGALGLIALPPLGAALGMDVAAYSRWIGVVMPTTAEAVIAGAHHSEDAFRTTGAYRLLVNLLLGLPVLAYLMLLGPKSERPSSFVVRTTHTLLGRMPRFVWGLALLGVIGVFGFFEASDRRALGNLTNWAFLVSLAGIGYQTRPLALWRMGWRTILICVGLWVIGVALMLSLPWVEV